MPAKDRMDCALGGHAKIAVEPAQQKLADLARAPMRLFLLGGGDEGLDLRRQLVGVAHRTPRPVAQRLQAVILVAIKDFVAGLARNAELPAHLAHAVALQKPGDEAQTLVHNRTLLPRHRRLLARSPQRKSVTHVSGTNCHPCLGPLTREIFLL
jgi:hypothetical protein